MLNRTSQLLMLIAVLTTGCYKEEPVSQNEIIVSMSGNKSIIPADGISKQLITIEINPATTDANNSITLTTNKGLFDIVAKNTITLTAENVSGTDGIKKIATTYLVSTSDEGTAVVTATIKNFSQSDTIYFTRSYPDIIRLQVDKLNYQLSNTGELTTTVQIKRNTGTGLTSIGQPITLTAMDSAQNSIGNFRNLNLLTDENGTCVNYFSLPFGSSFTGRVFLKASVAINAAGTMKSDSTVIIVYK